MRFAHASYRVTDRATCLAFYTALGFRLAEEARIGDATHLFLTLDPEGRGGPELELVLAPGTGYRHVAVATDDLDAALARLGSAPVRGPITTPSGTRLAFAADPDGYEVELIQYAGPAPSLPASPSDADASAPFRSIDVDPTPRVTQFLYHEAELLDDNRVRDWYALLAEDLVYEVPLRVTRERRHGAGFSPAAFHQRDTYSSIAARVKRLSGEFAWAEDPPSRTRRIVGNVRLRPGDAPGEHLVRSNLMLYRGRGDAPGHHLIVGERHDVLRETPGGDLLIARRTVYLDHTSLPTHNLAIFL
ncbi:hypothetical protein GCM10023205_68160 [Yinghuangia aomiensis]|uniref:VOC domain-containing protein n=1 Tax=Yinghuangia aomiensis TaxID=676205 RepID=A0ABP9I478_9ACTN